MKLTALAFLALSTSAAAGVTGPYDCKGAYTEITRFDNEPANKTRVKMPFAMGLYKDHTTYINPGPSPLIMGGDWELIKGQLVVRPDQKSLYDNINTACQQDGHECSVVLASGFLLGKPTGKNRLSGTLASRQEVVMDGHYVSQIRHGRYTCNRIKNSTTNPGAYE